MKVGTKHSQKKSDEEKLYSTGRQAAPITAFAWCGRPVDRPTSVHEATNADQAYTHRACLITRLRGGGV